MKQKVKQAENYLERIPKRAEHMAWETGENGLVTLLVENKGMMNRLAQKLLKKPRTSYIHLDKLGSFVWSSLDGQKNMLALGPLVKQQFEKEAEPLYERLAQYMQILDSYGFICWQNTKE